MPTARVSTKKRIVLPRKLCERAHVRPGDAFEFLDCDDPDVIVMRKRARRPNEGLVDALLACPHRFTVPRHGRKHHKKIAR
jgi:bifunctional DNA-binding transcriptional regulator/antitoxin component of YhaV-PrlF toxin-antitoxin module